MYVLVSQLNWLAHRSLFLIFEPFIQVTNSAMGHGGGGGDTAGAQHVKDGIIDLLAGTLGRSIVFNVS